MLAELEFQKPVYRLLLGGGGVGKSTTLRTLVQECLLRLDPEAAHRLRSAGVPAPLPHSEAVVAAAPSGQAASIMELKASTVRVSMCHHPAPHPLPHHPYRPSPASCTAGKVCGAKPRVCGAFLFFFNVSVGMSLDADAFMFYPLAYSFLL